jgi:predicted HicB family RNase H-like nuclease
MLALKGKARPMARWDATNAEVLRFQRETPVLRLRPVVQAKCRSGPSVPVSQRVNARKRFTFRLSVEDHAALKGLAEQEGISANALLTRALTACIERSDGSK